MANADKQELSAALDESSDKLLLFESLLAEKDGKLCELAEEINELRDSSSWLSNELESMISLNEKLASVALARAPDDHEAALYAASERKRAQIVDKLKEMRLRDQSRLKANEYLMRASADGRAALKSGRSHQIDRIERRSRTTLRADLANSGGSSGGSHSPSSDCYDDGDDDEEADSACSRELSDEERVVSSAQIYVMLRKFHADLQMRKEALQQQQQHQNANKSSAAAAAAAQNLYSNSSSTAAADDSGISADDAATTTTTASAAHEADEQQVDASQWRKLLAAIKQLIDELPCTTCYLMIAERQQYEQLQKVHARLVEEHRKQTDATLALNMQKTEQDTRLAALEHRCAQLQDDLNNCDKPKEEIVRMAWKARDEAVERKNTAEISLAKTRIENMQIASQLMEVVQQKGELSLKLAQFEVSLCAQVH